MKKFIKRSLAILLLLTLVFNSTVSSLAASISEKNTDEIPAEESAGTEISTEIPTETPTETPTEIPAETPSEVPGDEPISTPTETPEETPEEEPVVEPEEAVVQTIDSFVGYVDMFTPLQTIEITKDQKTTIDAIGLPKTMNVMVQTQSAEQADVEAADEAGAVDPVDGTQTQSVEPTGAEAAETKTAAAKTAATEDTDTTVDTETADINAIQKEIPVTWKTADDSDYETTDYETYDFKPVLPEGYILAEGVELPFITVKVGEANPLAKAAFDEDKWIGLANTYIATKGNADYIDAFYDAVSFNDEGKGALTWQNSGVDAADRWDGTADASCPSSGTTYNPTTPEQFLYALQQIGTYTTYTNDYTINLPKNGIFDMGGREHILWPSINLKAGLTLNGNGCSIYNLYLCNGTLAETGVPLVNSNTGMIATASTIEVKDLNFSGANVLGFLKAGSDETAAGVLIGKVNSDINSRKVSFENISFSHILVLGRGNGVGALTGRFVDNPKSILTNAVRILDNCNVTDMVASGDDHVAGLTGAISFVGQTNGTGYINRCYAIETKVISFGGTSKGHSGGLFSCMGGSQYGVTNCFADAQVYGQQDCGVFTGACNGSQAVAYMNCFSSGFVDGTSRLGGFVGSAESSTVQVYFFDCYSTALVGMNSDAEDSGGFIGTTRDDLGIMGASNCYAAGEVGNAATVSSGATQGTPQAKYTGGFAGRVRYTGDGSGSLAVLVNCFYDKQTTAMREYDVGNLMCLSLNKVLTTGNTANDNAFIINYMKTSEKAQGLRGTLTSTAGKSGTGLTDTPKNTSKDTATITTGGTTVETGFTGMRDDTACMTYSSTTKGWNDSTAFGTAAFGWNCKEKNHYPELSAFKDNKAEFTGRDAKVAKAYSLSSTSTVMLETWENDLDEATGALESNKSNASNPTTYDTVRDLTRRFNLTTTEGGDWYRIATQEGTPGGSINMNGNTVVINGKTYDVFTLHNKDNQYYADSFHPGKEWLEVVYVGATRKIRVMPTVGIEAGVGETLFRPNEKAPDATKKLAFYDHADDVELYYSTAERMAKDNNDITTGIYPDVGGDGAYTIGSTGITGRSSNPLTDNQKSLMIGSNDNEIETYFGKDKVTDDKYGNGNSNVYDGIDASYMSRNKGTVVSESNEKENTAKNSKLRVYARAMKSLNTSDGTFEADTPALLDLTMTGLADALNGHGFLPGDVTCSYVLLEYIWELNDGRTVRDAKILTIRNTPFSAEINTWEAGGLTDADKLVNNTGKTKTTEEGAAGRFDSENGLADTDNTVVNMKKVIGQLKDEDVAKTVENPGDPDTDPDDERVGKPLGFGNATTEAAHEYLHGSYMIKNNDGTETARKQDTIGPDYMDSLIASWQMKDPEKEVSKIRIRLDSGNVYADGENKGEKIYFTGEVDPRVSKEITVKYEYYRYVTEDNGKLTIVTEHKDRKYQIEETTISGKTVYYIVFNHYNQTQKTEEGNEVFEVDVVNNVQVDLELTAKLEFNKTVGGTYGDRTKYFDFKLNITDDKKKGLNTYNYQICDENGPITGKTGTVTEKTEATISLKHGQRVYIVGLLYGSTYTLSEDNSGDAGKVHYTVTTDGVENTNTVGNNASLLVDSLPESGLPETGKVYTADRIHKFINTYQEVVVTGVNLPDHSIPWLLILPAIFLLLLLLFIFVWERRRRAARATRLGEGSAGSANSREGSPGQSNSKSPTIKHLALLAVIGTGALLLNARTVAAADGANVNISAEAHTVGATPGTADTVRLILSGADKNTPMPEGATGTDKTVETVVEQVADFGNIYYSNTGVYTYRVSQSGSSPGYTYDTTIYEVTVGVTNDYSVQIAYKNLTTGKKVSSMEFWNRYSGEVTPGPVADLEISLKVYGQISTAEVFQYKVEFTGPGAGLTYVYTDEDGNVLGTVTSGDTISLTSGQKIIIKDVPIGTGWKVTQSQKPWYSINPGPGVLSGEIVEGENKAPFEAIYDSNKPAPVSIDPPVEKQITGKAPPGDSVFTFSMVGADADTPMPKGSQNGRKEFSITGAGSGEFGWITYERGGTYGYALTEVKGSLTGYTYDETIYTMTVTVTEEGGLLRAAIRLEKVGVGQADKVVFINHFSSDSGTVNPTGPPGTNTKPGGVISTIVNAVKTGDTAMLLPYLFVLIAASVVIILILRRKKKEYIRIEERKSIQFKEDKR